MWIIIIILLIICFKLKIENKRLVRKVSDKEVIIRHKDDYINKVDNELRELSKYKEYAKYNVYDKEIQLIKECRNKNVISILEKIINEKMKNKNNGVDVKSQEKQIENKEKEYLRRKFTNVLKLYMFKKFDTELKNYQNEKKRMPARKEHYGNLDGKTSIKQNKIIELDNKIIELELEIEKIRKDCEAYEVGIYEAKYDLGSSSEYKDKLDRIREEQKNSVFYGEACKCDARWLVGNSRNKGELMTQRNIKLMLRAFNGECDGSISKVSYKNINSMEKRIERSYNAINKLGKSAQCYITEEYIELKKNELFLVYEYQEKLYQEKEEQRIIKEQIREEQRAQKEFERAILKAEKEAAEYQRALKQAKIELTKSTGTKLKKLENKIVLLQKKLEEAESNKRAISQAQITKSGYIYIISNIGSFGENVYKIGMTRRLEPQDRIRELNGASVPFKFDVHAMIFSQNAPSLESKIHNKLNEKRVNKVNQRKEFFEVSLKEIEEVVSSLNEITTRFIYIHEAKEYRQSIAIKKEQEKIIS